MNFWSGSRYGLLILAAVSVTYFTENFLRSAPSALSPVLIGELGLTHAKMGLLISSYFFVYALMQVPSGVLSDTLGPRRTIIGFTAFTVIGALVFYFSDNLELLAAAQLLVGVGSSVTYINAVKILSSWFPSESRASAIGILSALSGLGNFAAYMGFPLILGSLGSWRPLYLCCLGLIAANLGFNFFILRDNPVTKDSVRTRNDSIKGSLRGALLDQRLYPLLLGYVFLSSNWVFLSWLPQFLTDVRGLSYIDVGLVSGVTTIMGIPGCIVIGFVSDRLGRRKLPLVAFSVASTALAALFLALPAGLPSTLLSVVAAAVGFSFSTWVLVVSMIPEVLPPSTAGVGLGLVNGIGTLAFSFGTAIYGALVDATGHYTISNIMILTSGALATMIFVLKTCET